MTTLVIINIAIEILCSIMCLVIIACIMIGESLRFRLNRAFVFMLLSNVAVMLSDALAFYSIGRPEPHFFVFNFVGNLCTFQFSYVLIMSFSNYFNIYLAEKIPIKRTAVYAIYGVCGLAITLTFFSLINDLYFIIDKDNVYHRQSMYWLSQVLGMIGMVLNAFEIIRHRRYFNRMEIFALAAYIILPLIAIAIQVSVYGYVSVYIASTLTILFIYIGMQAQYSKMLKQKELELTQSRIAVMLSQIQPHFLYNSLTAIAKLCDKDPAKAKKATIEFSEYLRGNMESLTENGLIPFKQELAHVEGYLSLEKAIYGNALNVVYNIEASDFLLPPLTVQPIVENAVKHGIGGCEDGGTVMLSVKETNSEYLLTISDDGVGYSDEDEKIRLRVGMENVKERLAGQCGGTIYIVSAKEKGTVVTIKIPKKGDDTK